MPGMTGLQLQSQLAAADCRIPIIFITAYDDKESHRRAMKAGAVAFLAKPFAAVTPIDSFSPTSRERQHGEEMIMG
jgi:FixJ family two-component response regulator